MQNVRILDKEFALSIPESEIQASVAKVAKQLNEDMKGKNPLFICILNGAFMFASDLMKMIDVPCEITFVKLASYEGVISTGKVKEVIGLNENIIDREIVIIEDIVDTGFTMQKIIATLTVKGAKNIRICTFLQKPDALICKDIKVDYAAMQIPNDFIVGYGLDYNGFGRNLKEIYTVIN